MWVAAAVAAVSILCIGDSITRAGTASDPYCAQLGGINVGVPGSTTEDWANLGTFEFMAAPHLAPDQTVHVLLGANDEKFDFPVSLFRTNLLKIVEKARGDGRTVVVTPMWDTGSGKGLIEGYTQVILELAEAGEFELGPIFYFDPPDTPAGGVHPTQAGQDHLADRLSNHLPVCRGDVDGDRAVGINDFTEIYRRIGTQCF